MHHNDIIGLHNESWNHPTAPSQPFQSSMFVCLLNASKYKVTFSYLPHVWRIINCPTFNICAYERSESGVTFRNVLNAMLTLLVHMRLTTNCDWKCRNKWNVKHCYQAKLNAFSTPNNVFPTCLSLHPNSYLVIFFAFIPKRTNFEVVGKFKQPNGRIELTFIRNEHIYKFPFVHRYKYQRKIHFANRKGIQIDAAICPLKRTKCHIKWRALCKQGKIRVIFK